MADPTDGPIYCTHPAEGKEAAATVSAGPPGLALAHPRNGRNREVRATIGAAPKRKKAIYASARTAYPDAQAITTPARATTTAPTVFYRISNKKDKLPIRPEIRRCQKLPHLRIKLPPKHPKVRAKMQNCLLQAPQLRRGAGRPILQQVRLGNALTKVHTPFPFQLLERPGTPR